MNTKWKSALLYNSFCIGTFISEFFQGIFTGFGFFFYETEIGLESHLVSLGFALFAIFRAMADPIIGHYLDKPRSFWGKWGRRFPWIVGALFPWAGALYWFYNAPSVSSVFSPALIFCWLLFSGLFYGVSFSVYSLNYSGLLPEKFREDSQRRKIQGLTGIYSYLGMLLGVLLPTLIIDYGVRESYSQMVGFCILIIIIPCIMLIPGVRENAGTILRPVSSDDSNSQPKKSYKFLLKMMFKSKNNNVTMILFFITQVIMSCVGGSLNYIIKYLWHEEIDVALYLYIGYFGGAFLGTIFWMKIGDFIHNSKKSLLLIGSIMAIVQLSLFFVKQIGYIWAAVAIFPFSFCFAGYWSMLRVPISADTLDELVSITKERKQTTFLGVRSILFQLAFAFQAILFALVHTITGFVEDTLFQTPEAEYGLIFIFAGIPLIFIVTGLLLFWKFYDLTPAKMTEVRARLKQIYTSSDASSTEKR